MTKAQLKDSILGLIIDNSQFSLFEIGQAYKRLRSFDQLLMAIEEARDQGRGLSAIVDGMIKVN